MLQDMLVTLANLAMEAVGLCFFFFSYDGTDKAPQLRLFLYNTWIKCRVKSLLFENKVFLRVILISKSCEISGKFLT